MKTILTLVALMGVVALSRTAQADMVPIASVIEEDGATTLRLYAEIEDGTPFGALLPHTAYTVNISSDQKVVHFGAAFWWEIFPPVQGEPDGFVLHPGGEVVFNSPPTYGVKDYEPNPEAYLYATGQLSDDSKQVSGMSTYYDGSEIGYGYWAEGSTILSLELITGSPGTSSFGLLYDTRVFTFSDDVGSLPTSSSFSELSPIQLRVVPVPGAALLGFLGIAVAGLKLRKRV